MPPAKEPAVKRKPRKGAAPSSPTNGVGEYAVEAARKTPEQIDTNEISTAVSWMRAGTEKFFQVHQFNPDELVARKGLKTYKKMRHDEQVKAASTAKKQAAISTGWEIEEPKIEGGEEIADEMRRFVEFNLGTDAAGGEMAGTMEQKLMEMMTAADFGYSVTEPTLKYIDYGEFEGFIGLKELKTRDPENIEFVTDEYGNLLDDGVVQFGRGLPKERFAIYSHDKEFDNHYGTSQLRSAYRPWWIKDTLLKFMTMAMERYGEPIAVATTEKKLSTGEQSRLDAMFKNLQNRTLITIPKFITLDFKVPQQRAGDAYASVMSKLDSWISRAILLPTKMGLSGESETGNYAQASEEFDLFLQIIGFMRRVLAALVNDRIIKGSLIDLNYEVTGGNYPKFKFREITQERKDAIYKLFLDGLSRNALTKVEADENRARSMIGWPELTEEELAEAEAEKQAMRERFEPEGVAEQEEGEKEFSPFSAKDYEREFDCVYCGTHVYHLPGEHDQCDHSPTGECVDPEWERSKENPANDVSLPKQNREILKRLGSPPKGFYDIRMKEDPDLDLIAKEGRLMNGEGLSIVKGNRHQCHGNVARLFNRSKIDNIATGYAQYRGAWYQHSWGVKDNKIVETTAPFDKYFGVILSKEQSATFTKRVRATSGGEKTAD